MSNGDLQYVSDTLLIERIALIDEVVYKQAGVLSDAFKGVANSVREFVAQNIDTSSTGSIIRSVLKILEPAILFKAHWMLGALDLAAQAYGISIVDMIWKMVSNLKGSIISGRGVTPAEVNRAAQSIAASASDDLFEDIRKYADSGELTKMSQWGYRRQPLGGPILPTRKTERRGLYRMFGFLQPFQRRRLAAAIVAWFMKTILLGAGLLIVGGSVVKMLGPERSGVTQPQPQQQAPAGVQVQQPIIQNPTVIQGPTPVAAIPGLGSPKAGLRYRANDARNVWYEPPKGTPAQTLLYWTEAIYPQLAGYEDIIVSDPNFRRIVSLLREGYQPGKAYMVMPMGFTRWVDIVNQFAGDVYRQIPKGVTDVATV